MERNRTSLSSATDPSTPQVGRRCPHDGADAAIYAFLEEAFASYLVGLRRAIGKASGRPPQDVDDMLHDACLALLERRLPLPVGPIAARSRWFCDQVRRLARSQRRTDAIRVRCDRYAAGLLRDGFGP